MGLGVLHALLFLKQTYKFIAIIPTAILRMGDWNFERLSAWAKNKQLVSNALQTETTLETCISLQG